MSGYGSSDSSGSESGDEDEIERRRYLCRKSPRSFPSVPINLPDLEPGPSDMESIYSSLKSASALIEGDDAEDARAERLGEFLRAYPYQAIDLLCRILHIVF